MRMRFMALALALAASGYAAEPQLRKQRLDAVVHTGDDTGHAAQFELACHGAADGALSLTIVLAMPDAITGFPLTAFEGPDGVGEGRDLATWSVDTRGKSVELRTAISGWYGVDGDGFLLSRSAAWRTAPTVVTFVRALVADDAQRVRLRVDTPDGGSPLLAEASLAGRQASLAAVAADCVRAATD